MREMRKKLTILAAILAMSCTMGTTAFGAGWVQNDMGWWYDNGDATWPAASWQWLDGNRDGVAECYYFNEDGYCLQGTLTPDGYQVNGDGAWIEGGIVQTRDYRLSSPEELSNHGIQMRIIVGDRVLTATLEDNATARAIAEQLPMTLPMMDLYGREMCYRFENPFPANEARVSGFQVGDIIYWRPRHSFVIMYHQDGEQFEMQKVGHINAEAAEIEALFGHGDVNVTYERVE